MIPPDDYLSTAQAAKITPGRPNATTVWRWMTKGRKGVFLKHRLFHTTQEWLDEFLDTVSQPHPANTPAPPVPKKSSNRERAIADAERELLGDRR